MDLRYHVITIIGLFLALAAGVVIGGAVSGSQQENRMVERVLEQMEALRQDDDLIREESRRTRAMLESRDEALAQLLPSVVRGRLRNTGVAIVVCGDWDHRRMLGSLRSRLQDAGATVTSVTTVPERLSALPGDQEQRHAPFSGAIGRNGGPREERPLRWLARYLVQGNKTRLVGLARAAGYRRQGDYDTAVRRVLMICRVEDEAGLQGLAQGRTAVAVLVSAFRDLGTRVVVTEPEDAQQSVSAAVARLGATSVDNGDSPVGELSIVLALAGAEGRFGSKPGAARVMPPLE